MHRTICGVLMLFLLAGCQNPTRKQVVDENAVMGPPPPRTSLDSAVTQSDTSDSPIQQLSAEAVNSFALINQLDDLIVARIGGQPVFAADVLKPFRPFIETQRSMVDQLPANSRSGAMAQLNAETEKLLQRAIPDYIDREVVLRSINRTLKPEQIDGIQQQIDTLFDERVDQIVTAAGLTSRAELEKLLARPADPEFQKLLSVWREAMGTSPGPSLLEAQESFGKMAMAAEFLRVKAKGPANVERAELLQYYRDHAEDYDIPLELRWEQIIVSHDAHGGKQNAQTVVETAVTRLRRGDSFAAVAKEHSTGPSAETGGDRGWIEPGSLVDTEIEDELFKMKVGAISHVFSRDDHYEIVRVAERRGGHRKPFADVQAEIRQTLLAEMQRTARAETLEQMREDADITVLWEGA